MLKSGFWLLTAILNPPQSPEKQLSATAESTRHYGGLWAGLGAATCCRTLGRSQLTALIMGLEKRLIWSLNGQWKGPQSLLKLF